MPQQKRLNSKASATKARPKSKGRGAGSASARVLNSRKAADRGPKVDPDWIRARKQLLKSVKAEVRQRVGEDPSDVRAAHREVERRLKSRFRPSSKSEILAELESVDFVLGGDFHAHGPAQRTHFKILRQVAIERGLILAMECFEISSQKWVDEFLAGRIDLEKLRNKAKWDSRWGFPFENYRSLLELARRRRWKILACGWPRELTAGRQGLFKQDAFVAKRLWVASLQEPGALIYLIMGELHLPGIERHLLTMKGASASRNLRGNWRGASILALHVMGEDVYFKLALKSLEHTVDVVRFLDAPAMRESSVAAFEGSRRGAITQRAESLSGVRRFVALCSPPWVLWQSYLLHLDRTVELEWADAGRTEEDFDPTDHVRRHIKWISQQLGLRIEVQRDTQNLSVYLVSDPRLWRKIENQLKATDRELARKLMFEERSFVIPAGEWACLGQPTVNHAAHLAGEYLQMKASGRHRLTWKFPSDFEAAIFVEGLAYFASKYVNPKRQSESFADLRASLQAWPHGLTGGSPAEEEREALRLALDQRMLELMHFHQGRQRRVQVRPKRTSSWLWAALVLGRMLGERIFTADRAHKLPRRELSRWFKLDVMRPDFRREYLQILGRLARAVGTEVAPSDVLMKSLSHRPRRERI